MKKKIMFLSFPILLIFLFVTTQAYAYDLVDDRGERIKGNIIYSKDGKALKEILRDEKGEISRVFVFTDHNKYGMIKKADIYDYNGIKDGSFEFLYKKAKLFRVDQKDGLGKLVKRSYIKKDGNVVNEYVKGEINWDYIREYNLIDKKYIRVQKKKNIEKSRELIINGKKYYYETIYSLDNKAIIEFLKDEDKNLILKYEFIEYDENNRVKKTEIRDSDDAILAYMKFIYTEDGDIIDIIYLDRDEKLTAKSEIKTLSKRFIEHYMEMKTEKKVKVSYEIDDKIKLIKEEK